MTITTTIPHTTYASPYSSAVITLCDSCAATGEYPIAHPIEPYHADDPGVCDRCGIVYRSSMARSCPLGIGDLVKVLRSCRLPTVEETLGVGQIRSITRTENGTILYWIDGFACARTERELRRTKTLADAHVRGASH